MSKRKYQITYISIGELIVKCNRIVNKCNRSVNKITVKIFRVCINYSSWLFKKL